ncbi:hypothetical protein H7U19_16530 [Hyunsoonleella sp. SJ7]|uniref:Uncharacterized protein n=1 Tax=Hyunsoonleella aquatilis TaxID=2762758 RepID=A0A923HIP0_9FLAO|nr:hypothetical protein [Hyunsoonleella aquatilis]MBC3760020.1 hypothetical protein [Hyunsoonleella aquatilis]
MKIRILILLTLVTSIYSCQEKSDFLSDCECVKIDLEKGIEVTDNLDRFRVTFPNENWEPNLHTDELGNGIVGALLDGDSFKSFGVTELTKAENWMSKKEMQADIESKYNVIESGSTKINGIESLWNLVDFKNDSIPSLTLYITTEHPTENLFYTLNLSVSKDKYGKKELCELENLMRTFKTN